MLTRVPSFWYWYHKCVDMWPKSNAKVVAWRQDSEWTCGQSQNGQNDRNLRFGFRAKIIFYIIIYILNTGVLEHVCEDLSWIKCRSNCTLQTVHSNTLQKVYAEFTEVYDLSDAIHFFDRFFQYQSCGIDPDIWVDMWPKFSGQFGHVAWEFCGTSTKMTVLKYSIIRL